MARAAQKAAHRREVDQTTAILGYPGGGVPRIQSKAGRERRQILAKKRLILPWRRPGTSATGVAMAP